MGVEEIIPPGQSAGSNKYCRESNSVITQRIDTREEYNVVGSIGYQAPEVIRNDSYLHLDSVEKEPEK